MPRRLSLPIAGGLALAATSLAAAPACVTEAEARSLATFALPAAIETVASRCATVLPGSDWLARGGAPLATRYRKDGGGAVGPALSAVERLLGQRMPTFLDGGTMQRIAEGAIAERVSSAVKLADCAAISRVAEHLSPLPLANAAALIVALIQLDPKTARAGLSICPAGATGKAG